MNRFLSQCADYVVAHHANDLKDCCMVFPNRRAGVFFRSYLQEKIKQPLIAPQIVTVNELIVGWSEIVEAEKLELIAILYDVFKRHTKTKETFDEFYFWGEVLLADFNDLDSYLINAKDLFKNIADIKEIENHFNYLSKEQKAALLQFWGTVAAQNAKENQQKFIDIWQKLYPIYKDFTVILKEQKIGYSGLIYRSVVEKMQEKAIGSTDRNYYIVGLNALNNCERAIFRHLQTESNINFFWDYDDYYVEDTLNQAGHFIRENLRLFSPPKDFRLSVDNFKKNKKIELVGVASQYGQAQAIPQFLQNNQSNTHRKFDDTAIVLADESLLFATLGAIEKKHGIINVTMGYPVVNATIYGFLSLLVQLLKNKRVGKGGKTTVYYKYATAILSHQLLKPFANKKVEDFLQQMRYHNMVNVNLADLPNEGIYHSIFMLPQKIEDYSDYFLQVLHQLYAHFKEDNAKNHLLLELFYAIHQAVERLKATVGKVLQQQEKSMNDAIYFRLFEQYIGQVAVAFEGEPLSGLQIMGVLETRCLDFNNLMILGFNESKWPRKFTAPSFIPFNIRKGFGLPSIDEQDAIYAYYFYRLLQRAENVTVVYSTLKEGINTGELSRYGYQLKYDSPIEINQYSLDFSFEKDASQPIEMRGSKEKTLQLLQYNSVERPLSPTAINTYLTSGIRFYFKYIMQIPEPEMVQDEVDSPIFGSIFHDVMEEIYTPFIGKVVNRSDILQIRANKNQLIKKIKSAIWKNYFKSSYTEKSNQQLDGKTLLILENAKTYINQILKVDEVYAPFTIVDLEGSYSERLLVEIDGEEREVCVGGKIDRIDKKGDVYRILDYKTGNVNSLDFKVLDDLFDRDSKKHPKEILQALIYTYVFSRKQGADCQYQSAVYSLRKIFSSSFNPDITHNKQSLDFAVISDDFVKQLKALISEMFSARTIFTPSADPKINQYDPYLDIYELF